jgi:hypothetical protein
VTDSDLFQQSLCTLKKEWEEDPQKTCFWGPVLPLPGTSVEAGTMIINYTALRKLGVAEEFTGGALTVEASE